MRLPLTVLSFLAAGALGLWAYQENYATQASLKQVQALQSKIAALREGLSVQRAEWAYLNRPDRLRELATLNYDRLGLLPMDSSQFGLPGQVAYPEPDLPQIDMPINIQGIQLVEENDL